MRMRMRERKGGDERNETEKGGRKGADPQPGSNQEGRDKRGNLEPQGKDEAGKGMQTGE